MISQGMAANSRRMKRGRPSGNFCSPLPDFASLLGPLRVRAPQYKLAMQSERHAPILACSHASAAFVPPPRTFS